VNKRKFFIRLSLPMLMLFGAVTLTTASAPRPAQAYCWCCDVCSPAEPKMFGNTGLLGMLFSNYDVIFKDLMGMGIKTIWEEYIASRQSASVMETAQQKAATKMTLANKDGVDSLNRDVKEAVAKNVSTDYTPSMAVCVQMSRLNQLRALEEKQKAAVKTANVERTKSFTGRAGTLAEKGQVAATAKLFTNYVNNYNDAALPAGMTGSAPRGANANIDAVGSIFGREQVAGGNQYEAAKDVATLIFAGGLTGPIQGDQLALPSARAQVKTMRRSAQAYAFASSVFTHKIESLRDPADLGASVSPDALFSKAASYETLSEHYLSGVESLNVSLRAQDSEKGNWQSVAIQVDSNSRLLHKIFERTEQWALIRGYMLREHLDDISRNMGDIPTPAMLAQ